jgi:hypothetical protein
MLQSETPPLSLYVELKDRQIPIATMIFKTFEGEKNERERDAHVKENLKARVKTLVRNL